MPNIWYKPQSKDVILKKEERLRRHLVLVGIPGNSCLPDSTVWVPKISTCLLNFWNARSGQTVAYIKFPYSILIIRGNMNVLGSNSTNWIFFDDFYESLTRPVATTRFSKYVCNIQLWNISRQTTIIRF